MEDAFAAADDFLLRNGRLLERRLFAALFLGQPPALVLHALRGYQNPDGGFGHALEPDTRCPASLPVYVETALQAMALVGVPDSRMVEKACDFLARTAHDVGAGGAVPLAFPVIENFPRAAHWTEWAYKPALNPTAGLVGILYQLDVDHPWREEGAQYCWGQLEAGEGGSGAHTLSEVLVFLQHVPDRERAEGHVKALTAHLAEIPELHLEPHTPGYGLSPLFFAPSPSSPWRGLFTTAQVDGHLDELERSQDDDGGWPLNWVPPDGAALQEWRGVVTLEALRALTAYGRMAPTRA